ITDKSRKGVGFVSYNVVPPRHTGLFSPPKLDLSNSGLEEFQQPEFEGYGPKTSKSVSEDITNEVKEYPDAPLVEELVSDDKSQSPRGNQRNWNNQNSLIARKVNAVKALACWVWRPTKLNSALITLKKHNYVDARGISKHMTRNMSYLSDFKEFDGGYFTFGGGAKEGNINGSLDDSEVPDEFYGNSQQEGCQFLRSRLISWQCKKQTIVSNSNTEAEYVAAASYCGQLEDSDGISNLPTTKIFEQLALMSSMKTAWEQFSSNIAIAIICLATNRKFNFSKMIFDGMGPVVQEVQGRHKHDMEPDFEFTTAEEVYTAEKGVSTAEPVSTAGASVSTAGASSAKDIGKAIMEEAETIQTKTKLQLEQERLVMDDIQARVEADEEYARILKREPRDLL
ncbi:hypothetical protein Tco_1024345, partial [Tanacetum coccineum]